MSDNGKPVASAQFAMWEKLPNVFAEPSHYDWLHEIESLRRQLADATRKLGEARKDAATAWTVCASIHRKYAKGKDPLFTTRQQDFVTSENKARALVIEQGNGESDGPASSR